MVIRLALAVSATACLTRPTGPARNPDAPTGSGDGASDSSTDALVNRNFMFVSSGTFGPMWDSGSPPHAGLADEFCTMHASQAGLKGNFIAWLSYGDGTNAASTLRSEPNPRDWYRTDGMLFAHSVDEIVTLAFVVAPKIDETGVDVTVAEPGVEVATGTASDGTYDAGTAANCPAGSIEIGYPGHTDASWTAGGEVTCMGATGLRLYCFSTGD